MPLICRVNAINLPRNSHRKRMNLRGKTVVDHRRVERHRTRCGARVGPARRRRRPRRAPPRAARRSGRSVPRPRRDSDRRRRPTSRVREDCERLIAAGRASTSWSTTPASRIFDPIETRAARRPRVDDADELLRRGLLHAGGAAADARARRAGRSSTSPRSPGSWATRAMGGYCATKFALIGFTEALRDEVIGAACAWRWSAPARRRPSSS